MTRKIEAAGETGKPGAPTRIIPAPPPPPPSKHDPNWDFDAERVPAHPPLNPALDPSKRK